MVKVQTKQGVYGKVRVIEGWQGIKRLYVRRIKRTQSYIVLDSERLTLNNMVEINGEYHFGTLKELNEALN